MSYTTPGNMIYGRTLLHRPPFFFGPPIGACPALLSSAEETDATAGLAAFGLRTSRLLRFCPLAIKGLHLIPLGANRH